MNKSFQNPCFLFLNNVHCYLITYASHIKKKKNFSLKSKKNLSTVPNNLSLQMNTYAFFGQKMKPMLLNTFPFSQLHGHNWCPLVILSPRTWASPPPLTTSNNLFLFQLFLFVSSCILEARQKMRQIIC